jgi:hypothetical protein
LTGSMPKPSCAGSRQNTARYLQHCRNLCEQEGDRRVRARRIPPLSREAASAKDGEQLRAL